jgi:cysteine desulfuration protein SufE
MTTPLPTSKEQLLEDFELFDTWEDRYAYLVDLGKRLPGLPDDAKTEDNKVRGCTSQVWFVRRASDDGRLRWDGDSDAIIVRGLVALLQVLTAGRTAAELDAADIDGVFQQLGLERHLSMNRRNGFSSMLTKLREWAAA